MGLSYGFCLDDMSSVYNSAQFSHAIHALTGDGVTQSGFRLSATASGFSVVVSTGYAMAAGRWLSNDEQLQLPVKASSDNDDRTDAIVVLADYNAREVFLEVMEGVDPDKLPGDLRDAGSYGIVLYLIRVPRGASSLTPDNLTDTRGDSDLCGTILPLSAVSGDALYVYNFLQTGLDAEFDRVTELGNKLENKADGLSTQVLEKADILSAALVQKGRDLLTRATAAADELGPKVGDSRIARLNPGSPWILCDGGAVPDEYPDLSSLLGGTLPNISRAEDRYRTYIYAG